MNDLRSLIARVEHEHDPHKLALNPVTWAWEWKSNSPEDRCKPDCTRCALDTFLAQPAGSLGEMAERWESISAKLRSKYKLETGEMGQLNLCASDLRDWLARASQQPLVEELTDTVLEAEHSLGSGEELESLSPEEYAKAYRKRMVEFVSNVLAAHQPNLTDVAQDIIACMTQDLDGVELKDAEEIDRAEEIIEGALKGKLLAAQPQQLSEEQVQRALEEACEQAGQPGERRTQDKILTAALNALLRGGSR